jgi:hypothetical protein
LGTALWTVSTEGGEPRVVASGVGVDWPKGEGARNNRCFTVRNGQAFWTKLTGSVLSLPSAKNPRSFAVDDDAIYWTNDGSGVWRAPKRAP